MKRKYSTRTFLILGLISAVLISVSVVIAYCQGTLLEPSRAMRKLTGKWK